jgi:hypothetical protein
MVQIFSLTLPETYPCSISIYGIFAIRDVLHPGRNYLFRRSRDNSITIHPVSILVLLFIFVCSCSYYFTSFVVHHFLNNVIMHHLGRQNVAPFCVNSGIF